MQHQNDVCENFIVVVIIIIIIYLFLNILHSIKNSYGLSWTKREGVYQTSNFNYVLKTNRARYQNFPVTIFVACEASVSVGFSARSRHENWGEPNMHWWKERGGGGEARKGNACPQTPAHDFEKRPFDTFAVG